MEPISDPPLIRRPSRPARSGFSLIELIVVIAIMAILAGAAVPVTSKVLTSKARQATRTELAFLSEAAGEFFRDLRRLPADIEELIVHTGESGWSGPYLPGVVTDEISGLTGYQVDSWSRPYQVTVTGSVLTLTSAGEDSSFGTARDLAIELDVTPIRRAETLHQLGILNQAIVLYNAQWQATDPLPASWTLALSSLVNRGFLPSGGAYDVDWWGSAFVEDPAGGTPVVRVRSVNVSAGSAGGGGAGSGSGNNGNGNGNGNGWGAGGSGQGNNGNGNGNGNGGSQ